MRILFVILISGFSPSGAFAQTKIPSFEGCAVSSDFNDKAANFLVSPLSKKDFPNIFRPFSNFFKHIFGKKSYSSRVCCRKCNCFATINEVVLSRKDVIAGCPSRTYGSSCPHDTESIIIWVKTTNPFGNEIQYKYEVTAGKIKGNGATVVWDLSGVKAGTYQIVTRIDEGIGFGQPRVDNIKVVECQEC